MIPPSTQSIFCPVINTTPSEAKNATAETIGDIVFTVISRSCRPNSSVFRIKNNPRNQ